MVETRGGRRFAVLFFVASFVVLFLGRWLTPVNHLALSVAAPFGAVINTAASGIGDTVSAIANGPGLRAQNQQMEHQLGKLLRSNLVLQQKVHDYAMVSRMVRYDDNNSHVDFLTARVIFSAPTGPNGVDSSIIINRGKRDGLRDGMTVVDQNGYFVGSIVDLSSNAARVLLMVSPSSSVGALDLETQSTGAAGLVEGVWNGLPVFDTVPTRAVIHTGDWIVTSGQLNLYPRTLLLGQVVSVQHANVALTQQATIQPAANFRDLEWVQVIRNWVPDVPMKLVSVP